MVTRVAHSDMCHSTKSVQLLMAFQIKLLAFGVFLLLSLSFCNGKNVTVKVIGQIQCKDCIKHEFSSSHASLGIKINVYIHCKSRKRETNTQGNGAVDREGKFNVTLSAEITKDGYTIDSCFAKLQNQPTLPCPIQSAETASVKILTSEHNTIIKPMILIFSPITCQSAFFLPHPKFTFFHTLPPRPVQPIEHAPPPSEAPPENSIPPRAPALEPLYLPPTPAPAFQSPQNPPNPAFEGPYPSPSPIYTTPPQIPPSNEPIPPPFFKQLPKPPPHNKKLPPPPKAFHRTPFVTTPILPPIPPPHHKEPHSETPFALPVPILKPPTPFGPNPGPSPYPHPPLPKVEKPIPPPPNQRKSNPIPRAPPVPQLPPIPPVPRKYFNPPNSKSQPPHSS